MSAPHSGLRFREREELLDFLLEVSSLAAETLDLDELLARLADVIRHITQFDLFAILLFSERAKGLRIRYAQGHREEIIRSLVVPLGEGLTGTAAATRQIVVVGDVRSDSRYLNTFDLVRSEVAVPMVHRRKLVGVIDLQSTRPDAFGPQEVSLIRLVAGRVATAIENATLYKRLERQNRTLKTLAHLSAEFSSILDLDELLGKLAERMRVLMKNDSFSLFLLDREREVLVHRFSVRHDGRFTMQNLPVGTGITGHAALLKKPVRVGDITQDQRYVQGAPGIRSEMAVPLVLQDRLIGVMDLESERLNHFTEDHQRLLTLLAPQIASAVENARLYEEIAQRQKLIDDDLRAARRVQQILLPRQAPAIPGLEIALGVRPAREISGDIYDFFVRDDHTAMLAFGDVSGKGAAAALYGALISGLLRTAAPAGTSPAAVLRALNDALLERKVDATYVTLLLLFWNKKESTVLMANAGAIPPMVCRNGELLPLRLEGVPLGLLDDQEYEEVRMEAQPGDTLLLYSDGIPDQTNPHGQEYGPLRLFQTLKGCCAEQAQGIVNGVFADLDRFTDGAKAFDDQTLVAIKVGRETICKTTITTS